MSGRVDLSVIHEQYVSPETLDDKTGQYLQQLAPYRQRQIDFCPEKAALVLVDFQRCFLDPGFHLYSANGRAVVERTAQLAAFFRERKRPVIFTLQKNKGLEIDRGPLLRHWWPSVPLEDIPDTEPVDDLRPLPEEKVIPKRRYSGFLRHRPGAYPALDGCLTGGRGGRVHQCLRGSHGARCVHA